MAVTLSVSGTRDGILAIDAMKNVEFVRIAEDEAQVQIAQVWLGPKVVFGGIAMWCW